MCLKKLTFFGLVIKSMQIGIKQNIYKKSVKGNQDKTKLNESAKKVV